MKISSCITLEWLKCKIYSYITHYSLRFQKLEFNNWSVCFNVYLWLLGEINLVNREALLHLHVQEKFEHDLHIWLHENLADYLNYNQRNCQSIRWTLYLIKHFCCNEKGLLRLNLGWIVSINLWDSLFFGSEIASI